MRTAGVVLAGGRSTRMGRAKAGLPWHGSTFLYRTSALLRRTVDGPVVVVAAPGQGLPELPAGVEIAEDPVEGLGPMQGVAVGLASVAGRAESAFVCSTDMPFLHPAYVRRVMRALAETGADLVLPWANGHRQPLATGYRTALHPLITRLIGEGDLRPGMLPKHCEVAQLDDAVLLDDRDLRQLDPRLDSVVNVNTPEDYAAALARELPEITVNGRTVRAATLGPRASAVVLNGVEIAPDPLLPLVAGDSVTVVDDEE
ncbi:molybdenum cofactor guanylyltransferase [Kibdelosporangium phytohabitans]|uniref:molybdenum cofactor guanylyltransferase n=1 Tax=Kibdelosporangium phytohabitans TaxID=860235 RepID=UPI0019F108BC|nr:molybdenum cofactor guanylyltransferase [Kibdelosporangium phytohabitans]MBE1463214.1 molybdopterin-guanine dinucleotide biosynthesis protein A [Kibdelosporangium phytohabitans]